MRGPLAEGSCNLCNAIPSKTNSVSMILHIVTNVALFLSVSVYLVFVYVLACGDPPLGGGKNSIGCHETP